MPSAKLKIRKGLNPYGEGTKWYVDSSVGSSGNGQSWATAWKQPSNIVWASIDPGDTIYFSGGTSTRTYTPMVLGGVSETLTLGAGTLGNPVRYTRGIDAGHTGEPIVDGGAAAIAINTDRRQHVVIDHLAAQNTNDCAIWADTPLGVIIEYCRVTASGAAGGNCRGLHADSGASDRCLIVRYNTFDTSTNTTSQADCIYMQDMDGAHIHNNTIYQLNADATGHSDGIQLYDCGDIDVYDNFIEVRNGGNDNHAIWASDTRTGKRYIIRGNTVWMRGTPTTYALTHWNEGGWTGRAEILNNTVYGGDRCINIDTSSTATIIKNNIMWPNTGDHGIVIANVTLSAANVNYNLIYAPSSIVASVAGADKSWAQWQALGFDANGVNADPTLTNVTTGDFTLVGGSPAINAGINVGLPFNGAAPDIGALETA